MKKIILLLLCSIMVAQSIIAQDKEVSELKELYNEEQFDTILSRYTDHANDYPARSIYYIGMAYYMKADDNNCLKYMDMSINKDSKDPDPYYIKGMTYNYMSQFNKAITSFEKALQLDPLNGDYLTGLGDSYLNMENLDKALEVYIKATEQEEAPDRPFIMIPQIYDSMHKREKALEAFYKAKNNISRTSDSFTNILFNIGMYEALLEHFDKAEFAFNELLEINPKDYYVCAKLIQIHYARKEFEKAEVLKQKLYKAYSEGLLKGNMSTMFCINQFTWQDKQIRVFEKFAEPEGELYYKHVFYVLNGKDEIECSIQTENSVVSVELGGLKYILGMNKGDTHSTFSVGFKDDVNYEDLKRSVIMVLEGKLKAAVSSTINKD